MRDLVPGGFYHFEHGYHMCPLSSPSPSNLEWINQFIAGGEALWTSRKCVVQYRILHSGWDLLDTKQKHLVEHHLFQLKVELFCSEIIEKSCFYHIFLKKKKLDKKLFEVEPGYYHFYFKQLYLKSLSPFWGGFILCQFWWYLSNSLDVESRVREWFGLERNLKLLQFPAPATFHYPRISWCPCPRHRMSFKVFSNPNHVGVPQSFSSFINLQEQTCCFLPITQHY